MDHCVFENYSGPVKCFSCSAMMEVKSTGGEVYSINPLAVHESRRKEVSSLRSGYRSESYSDVSS
jgi:hypothetical protein